MSQRHQSCSDIIDFRFFFNNLTTDETFETNNEAMAWAKFNSCMHPCELFCDGDILAEKDFEDDPINDRIVLVDTNYTGTDFVELEEVEV